MRNFIWFIHQVDFKRCEKRIQVTSGRRKLTMENKKSIEDINMNSFPSCSHCFCSSAPPCLLWGYWPTMLLQAGLGLKIPPGQSKNRIACCILNQTADSGVNGSLRPVWCYQYSSDIYFAAFHYSEHPEITNTFAELRFKSNSETEANHSS